MEEILRDESDWLKKEEKLQAWERAWNLGIFPQFTITRKLDNISLYLRERQEFADFKTASSQ